MKICSTSQNDPGWLQEEFLAIQLFVQPLLVALTERKNVGGQSGLEAQLCLNRIKLSEWLLLVCSPEPTFVCAFSCLSKHTDKCFNCWWKAHTPKKYVLRSTHPKKQVLNGKGRKIGNGYAVFAHAAGSWEDVTHVPAAHISYLFWSRREVQPKLPWQHLHCSKPLSFALVQVCSHLLSNSSMSTLFSHTHSSPSTIRLAATGVLMLDVHLIPISTNTIN